MKRTRIFGVLLAALALVFSAALEGQTITGGLVVNVTDTSGAVIPGASLDLVNVATGISLSAVTDGLGNHLFALLKAGEYRLTVKMQNLKTKTIEGIRIQTGQRARANVTLEVGTVTETVEVTATAATLLNAESPSIGQVITREAITELPLDGRNFIQLAAISAGAVPIGIGVSPASGWTGRGDSTLSIAGGRETNVSFLVNGIETRNSRFGNAGVRPSAEAIQEFRVQRSTFGAEFGRSSAIINTTIRSGSNQVHGSVYEFLRNRNVDANDYFSNRSGQAKPPLTQNNFGVAVGGPVIRDKTFWFFNYEGFRQRKGVTQTGVYPSRAQLGGDLSDDSTGTGIFPTSSPICQANPGSRKCVDIINPFSGLPFANNQIPSSMLDPQTQEALPFIVTPNVAVPVGTADFPDFNTIGAPNRRNDWDQYNVRIDHQFNESNTLNGVYSDTNEQLAKPRLAPVGGDGFPQSDRLIALTYHHIFSPTMLNEFRFGYNRSRTFRQSEGAFGKNYAKDVFGLKNTSDNPFDFGVPIFNIAGFDQIGSLAEAIGATDTNWQFVDNFSINTQKHNIRMGFQISDQKYDQITDFAGNPSFNFDGRFSGNQGLGLGDFLLGTPFSARSALGDSSQFLRTTYYAGYIQDDWRILPTLTLNVGVRYEYAKSPVEKRNKSLYFVPETGQVVTVGHGVRRSIVDPDFNNVAPRLGFAYRPMKNTVIRGGVGIYYATDNFNEEQFKVIGPPLFESQTVTSDPTKPTLAMKDMMPSLSSSKNKNPFSFDRLNRTPYVSQWSFGIQRSFSHDYVLEVEYAGSTGQKLPQRRNLNIASIDPTGTIPIELRRPYPDFAFVLLTYNGGWSSYQALTTKLEKRFSNGLYLLASYTFQKSLDLGATDEFSAISADFKTFDKGHSTFDVPHRFVFSYVYELPIGRGKSLGGNVSGVLDKVVSGWQVTGITTFSQGQFQTPLLGINNLNIGAFSQSRPDIIGDPKQGQDVRGQYFNRAAFDFPRDAAGNQLSIPGNAARNSLQMPGLNNWDMGVLKNTAITERFNLQFRWEMFNAFNHTQFGPADRSMTSPTFGTINGTLVDGRRMQFGLKLLF